jgi:hypothetical protein
MRISCSPDARPPWPPPRGKVAASGSTSSVTRLTPRNCHPCALAVTGCSTACLSVRHLRKSRGRTRASLSPSRLPLALIAAAEERSDEDASLPTCPPPCLLPHPCIGRRRGSEDARPPLACSMPSCLAVSSRQRCGCKERRQRRGPRLLHGLCVRY